MYTFAGVILVILIGLWFFFSSSSSDLPFSEEMESGESVPKEEKIQDYIYSHVLDDLPEGLFRESDQEKRRLLLRECFTEKLEDAEALLGYGLNATEKERVFLRLTDEILGFGPLQSLLDDELITAVKVEGPSRVFSEKVDQTVITDVRFRSEDHLRTIVERILAPLGKKLGPPGSEVKANLPDGSSVEIAFPDKPGKDMILTIRKIRK